MAATRLSDIFVPQPFTAEVIERTSEKTAFIQSGVMQPFDVPIGAGKTIDLPFFQDLSGADNVLSDTTDITLNKIDSSQDTAAVLIRERSWGSTDLAAALGQRKPLDAILELVSNYWARRRQATAIQAVNGALGSFVENTSDISALSGVASDADGAAFVDATAKLGDHSDAVTDIAVHSSVEASLRKKDLIDFIRDSDGNFVTRTFQGRQVHIDDGMPNSSGNFTSYLFAPGALGFAEEEMEFANEMERFALKDGGSEAIITRRKEVIHPRGVRWTPGSGVPAGATPTNAELADSANWTRVWEPQNIRIVRWITTVA